MWYGNIIYPGILFGIDDLKKNESSQIYLHGILFSILFFIHFIIYISWNITRSSFHIKNGPLNIFFSNNLKLFLT